MEIGYKLSSEEHAPNDLVRNAARAESIGMTFALISDHFHPWIDKQGQSPFVWSTLGGIAHVTQNLTVGTGVTCPTMRMHPAIVAHAAATAGVMMPGRFFLGVGSGEHLNEHVLGQKWPSVDTRQHMLEDAVEVMRKLWTGKQVNYSGEHYSVENARLYTCPEEPVPVMVAAAGTNSATLAGRIGDGLISVAPKEDLVNTFNESGGEGKPRYVEVHVCWAPTEEGARKTAYEWWPNVALKGQLTEELPLPAHLEQATKMVSEEEVAAVVSCGPDPEVHLDGIKKFLDAGFDHLTIHQVGPNQESFFDFYEKEVIPRL